ncbi:MAG: hypothetical protein CL676_02495 [Bdellovibrionaceae bacterium]|mgnify:CR=1 FL=1|nr:hypothetical protein [Pseudobdellovibrionaceae bacterium]|tara:strand:- start:5027 stop:5326 length:300 start_codon:yes stop_codon:yes gene_type:complete
MKLPKTFLKTLIGILSAAWTLGAYAQEVSCTQPTQENILKVMESAFFQKLSPEQQIEFLEKLELLGIDVDDSLFQLINIDEFEMQSGEKPSTILTTPKR